MALFLLCSPLAGLAKTPSRLGADSRSKSASSLSVRSSYLANKSAGLARQSSFEELSDHAQVSRPTACGLETYRGDSGNTLRFEMDEA